jgi:mono/diheme cytochrome c family protein
MRCPEQLRVHRTGFSSAHAFCAPDPNPETQSSYQVRSANRCRVSVGANSFKRSRGSVLIGRVFLATGLCWILTQPALAQQQSPRQEVESGADVYEAACAACHGIDGRGNAPSIVGFSVPLPDFTDCLFATVEADEGWEAVVHQGGPVRALDRHMPAFGAALSPREIRLVVAHVRTFCAERSDWPQGDLNLPRALLTEKAFPENESLVTTTFLTGPAHAVSSALVHERRFGARTMVEFNVPFEIRQADGGRSSYGLGDIAVAVKRDLFHSMTRGTIVSAGQEIVLPTGKEHLGLGSGVTTFETFGAVGQRLPDEAFVQFHFGVGLPTNPEIVAREAFWRTAVGKTFIQGGFYRAWTPMLEIIAARELERGAAAEWDIVPQMQVSLSKRRHILVSGGVQVPISQRDGRHPQVLTYLLWDWYEGGFFDGWK